MSGEEILIDKPEEDSDSSSEHQNDSNENLFFKEDEL